MSCENIFNRNDTDEEDLPDFLSKETNEKSKSPESEKNEWAQMVEESRMYEEAEAEEMWKYMEANRENVPEGMKIPFTGHPDIDFIGLTNEEELAEICPEDFKQDNPWTKYASHFVKKDVKRRNRLIITTHWRYKPGTEEERRHKLSCFTTILASPNLHFKQKIPIAGWMLSEILEEVPEYRYKIDYWENSKQ